MEVVLIGGIDDIISAGSEELMALTALEGRS